MGKQEILQSPSIALVAERQAAAQLGQASSPAFARRIRHYIDPIFGP